MRKQDAAGGGGLFSEIPPILFTPFSPLYQHLFIETRFSFIFYQYITDNTDTADIYRVDTGDTRGAQYVLNPIRTAGRGSYIYALSLGMLSSKNYRCQ